MTGTVQAELSRGRPWQAAVLIGVGLSFALVYFVSFGSTAWHATDYEYMFSAAWRVAQGAVPYRDFIYHKPPGSPYLHAAWFLLPDGWQVRASRLGFYCQVALPAVLPALWALRRGRTRWGLRLPALVLAAAIWAAHTFPAMAWQTTDGVMFATIGLVALAESLGGDSERRRLGARVLASASMALAVLCKQSFFTPCLLVAGVAFAELGGAALRRSRSWTAPLAKLAASSLPAILLVGGAFAALGLAAALGDYRAQFQSQSNLGTLREYGFSYMPGELAWVIGAAAALPCLSLIDASGRRAWAIRAAAASFLGFLAWFTWQHASEGYGSLGYVLLYTLVGTFLGRAALAATTRRADVPALILHAGFVLIAWSCQLSLGYSTPVLGIAGLGWVLHEALPAERRTIEAAPALALAAVVAVALWNANWAHPYRDAPRATLTHDLGQVFYKLAGIRTSPGTYNRYLDLRRTIDEQVPPDRRFAVLQDYPGAHWLYGERTPIALDWCFEAEVAGFEARLMAELERTRPFAIIPKDSDAPWASDPQGAACDKVSFEHHNGVSRTVARTWRLAAQTQYFCVYEPR